ncbi:Uncharacterised protein [Mycobacteroides abscessus]|nr:Uncharacterised protein [Mycobacteroides abscessus]
MRVIAPYGACSSRPWALSRRTVSETVEAPTPMRSARSFVVTRSSAHS